MENDIRQKFQEYLFPPIDEDISSREMYIKCIQCYTETLKTHQFFRGYRFPSVSIRGQIYRTVFLLNSENLHKFGDNSAWIVICTKFGVIVLNRVKLKNILLLDIQPGKKSSDHQLELSKEINQSETLKTTDDRSDTLKIVGNQSEISKESNQSDILKTVHNQSDTSKGINQSETSKEGDQLETSKEINQLETSKEIDQSKISKEINQLETSKEIDQSKTSKEISVNNELTRQAQLFDFYFNQEDYIFCPPGFSRLNSHDFYYSRRLLTDFLNGENLELTQIHMNEQGKRFLFYISSSPIRRELERKWSEYLQGGIIRTCIFDEKYLLASLRCFSWNERISFECLEGQIKLNVRLTSLNQFHQKEQQILRSSTSEFKNWYRLDCAGIDFTPQNNLSLNDSESSDDETVENLPSDTDDEIMSDDETVENDPIDSDLTPINLEAEEPQELEESEKLEESKELEESEKLEESEELEESKELEKSKELKELEESKEFKEPVFRSNQSVFGAIYAIGSDWEILPLIGTSQIYVRNRFSQDLTREIIQEKLLAFALPKDLMGNECYSLTEFSEMNIFEQADCQCIDGNYFSRMELLRASNHPHFRNPLTQAEISLTILQTLQSFRNWISLELQSGFLSPNWEPEINTLKEGDFYHIYLTVSSDISIRIWSIPDFSDTSYFKLTEGALELITTKFSNKLLLNDRYFATDPCLSLHPKILYLYEQTQQGRLATNLTKDSDDFFREDFREKFRAQICLIDTI